MFNVCHDCGAYRPDKTIEPRGPYATCPVCGHKHSFLQLPLLIVSGASGTGKSTVCHNLLGALDEVVLLDSDILWRHEFDRPEDNYRDFFETWLRICKNIAQSGRPVVLFGAGMGIPANMEPCIERRYFSELHYLALTCEAKLLAARLGERPKWQNGRDPAFVEEQIRFNRWFRANASKTAPPIELLDTTRLTIQETTTRVASWIRQKLATRPAAERKSQR